MVVRKDRYCIVQLVSVRIRCIVYQYHTAQVAIQHPKILDVEPLGTQEAMLAKKTMMNIFTVGVQMINHHVGIAGVTGCENNHFKVLA